MLVPEDLRYSHDHQWVRLEGDMCRVGITAYAQEALGEVTMVQLSARGTRIAAGDEMGEIEAFKAMTDLYMPIEGEVIEHNESLMTTPTAINDDPYGAGWLCLMRPVSLDDLADLHDAQAYRDLIGADAHG